MAKKPEPFAYGVSPNPKSWHETAQHIRNNAPKKKKSSGFYEKLERMIKEQVNGGQTTAGSKKSNRSY